ncbi:hypothetical protein GCM10010191_09430 [Actinomadura vinacea]|uniref:Luciferase-like domain-containing protein n=1 Tax=Actinomadura vinacea TaxID=115336 RepID=A0ABN3IG60_9ACTN
MSPLNAGSVSLGLSLPPGYARDAVAQLKRTARLAIDAGFDGVTLSEHHGGFPGYPPTPMLLSALLLEHLPAGWAIPCPTILPLRPPALVAEELAWLAAAHPGRVGAGFVPGYQERDFAVAAADFATRRSRHWTALAEVTAALRGENGLRDDPAVAQCAPSGLPIVTGVAGQVGARRAAEAGAGLLLMSLTPAADLAPLVQAHRDAGGGGPLVLIRRVGSVDGMVERWRSRGSGSWLAAEPAAIVSGPPEEWADTLAADLRESGATALNVRLDGAAAETHTRIERFAAQVLPELRSGIASPAR